MALTPIEIATLSQLLDEALALPATQRQAWLAALPAQHQAHAERLRDMLQDEGTRAADLQLPALPKAGTNEAVAHADERIGAYRLLREIGRGGMGSVWLAERADGAYKRQVALKLPRLAWGAGLAERMAREREIGMLLEHPNIARLYDAGVDERGRPFLALEFVDGQPIDAWCEAQGLSVRDRLRLFVQVARAVAYAHGRLVVHRDLKPSNVLVTPDGQAHLLDFGIAKLLHEAGVGAPGLTQSHERVMTPHYAAPEQVAGEAITVQTDVYALGVLLYELLTGTRPIEARRASLGAVEDAILQGDAPPASGRVKDKAVARALRGEVDAILGKAMQREPARRYATADALALDIERHLNGETVAARPDSLAYRLHKAVRRHWIGLLAAAAVLAAVLSGAGVAVVQAQKAARASERERVVKDFVADVFRVNSRIDPKNASIRPTSTKLLLEEGAQLIQRRFAGQPELQAELYGVVGGVFSDLGAYALAADYLARQSESLTTMGASAPEQSKVLMALGQAFFDDGKYSDAEVRARRAAQLAGQGSEAVLDALVLVARVQLEQARYDLAAKTMEGIEREVNRTGKVPTRAKAWSLYIRARLQAIDNRLEESLPTYQAAIDAAVHAEGGLSTTATTIHLSLARWLAGTGYRQQAQEHFDAAASVLRQLGGAHEVRAAYEEASFSARRYLYAGQTSAQDALHALAQSRATLSASTLPMPVWFIPEVDYWTGRVMVVHGDIAAGVKLLEANAPVLQQSSDSPLQQASIARSLATGLMAAGRHEQATGLFETEWELRRQTGDGSHPYAVVSFELMVRNQLMQGHVDEAERILKTAPDFAPIREGGGTSNRFSRRLVRALAHVRWVAGRVPEAKTLLAESAPEAGESFDHRDLLGEVLCATGKQAEGLAMLNQNIAIRQQRGDHAHAPWNARRRSVAGLCAYVAGDRSAAVQFAADARAAFTAQPGVSPYYKAPLFKLERALGLKLPPV